MEEIKPQRDSEKKMEASPHQQIKQQPSKPEGGGLRTMPFIIVTESFEKVASYGLLPNMIFYLMNGYHVEAANGASMLSIWSSISNFLAIVGAFLADSYMGRFWVILLGSFSSLLGTTTLWSTGMIPQLKPAPCNQLVSSNCSSATPAQFAILLSSFGLISIGAGCVRPCSIAFGADQLDNKDNPKNKRVLETFFNWYYASASLSGMLAFTIIVHIQDHLGWKIGFGVPAILMVLSTLMFLFGSHLYIKVQPDKSLFTSFIQVIVASLRKISLYPSSNTVNYYHAKDSNYVTPTDNLRFLNKACMIENPEEDLNPDGTASNPWKLCSIGQVESLKALLRITPMCSTGIIILLSLNQQTFATLQAKTMHRHISPRFQIPAGSFTVFTNITVTLWIAIYDRAVVPILVKFTGHPRGLSPKMRMGIGLLLSAVSMAAAAVVENKRRKFAIDQGLVDEPEKVMDMSAMWLIPQFSLIGLAEAFNAIGQIEFYYSQLPKSMSSMAMAIFTLGMAVANLIGGLLVKIVDRVTRKHGKESWPSSNLNKGHLDYFYWLLMAMCLVNFGYFLVCCWAYGPSVDVAEMPTDKMPERKKIHLELESHQRFELPCFC